MQALRRVTVPVPLAGRLRACRQLSTRHKVRESICSSQLAKSRQIGVNQQIWQALSNREFHTATVLHSRVKPYPLADIGEGIAEVLVKEWYVKVGDVVKEFDPICEVQSDKATVTISSRYTGVIVALHYEVDDSAAVGQPIVDIELEEGAGSNVTSSSSSSPSPSPSSPSTPTSSSASSAPEGKHIRPFHLADIGEGIAKVIMREWHVAVGDTVREFDPICDVQSDKATATITSPYAGVVVALHYEVDDTAFVGKPIVDIEVAGSADASPSNSKAPAPLSTEGGSEEWRPAPTFAQTSNQKMRVLTTPAVRRLARENDIDLASVRGSGKDGRVLKCDIVHHLSSLKEAVRRPSDVLVDHPLPPTPTATPAAAAVATPSTPKIPLRPPVPKVPREDRVENIVGFRKAMVKTMTAANAIPTFGFNDEVSMDALVTVRAQLKDIAAARGIKLSFMPFFLKAASMAILQYPVLNSSPNADCSAITYKAQHNIGVAMDTPDGLVVPNIKSVQDKSIFEIAAELQRLIAVGAAGKLGPADLTGGTFTLSNIGAIGGTYARPILLPNEVLIGALGRTQIVPRFDEDDEVIKAHILNISWSADHRVIDGATVARFSNLWKQYLEQPANLLVDMR